MRRFTRILFLVAVVAAMTTHPVEPVRASGGTTLIGSRDDGNLGKMRWWQGKHNAVANFFGQPDFGALLNRWNHGSVPLVSWTPPYPAKQIAAGLHDTWINAVSQNVKAYLAGPDAVYGNADDRRVYLRPAWEGNWRTQQYSPCYTGSDQAYWLSTAADYRGMWHRLWNGFALRGIDNTRAAWIFNVNQVDACAAGRMENLYPGAAYVDWMGVDGFNWGGNSMPEQIFTDMVGRVRAIAPGKPVGIQEVGVDTFISGGVAGKSAWITAYFEYLNANDIRMSSWINSDFKDGDRVHDFTVLEDKPHTLEGKGDELFQYGNLQYWAYSAYRQGVANPWVVGSDQSNPRLLTDAQFLGQ